MTDRALTDLFNLIENEIDLGFTLLDTARLAGSGEHRDQAIRSATVACETAEHFMGRVPPGQEDRQRLARLAELKDALGI